MSPNPTAPADTDPVAPVDLQQAGSLTAGPRPCERLGNFWRYRPPTMMDQPVVTMSEPQVGVPCTIPTTCWVQVKPLFWW